MQEVLMLIVLLISILLSLYGAYLFLKKYGIKNTENVIINNLEKKVRVYKENKQRYVEVGNKSYELHFHYLREEYELTINSPKLWEEHGPENRVVNKGHITNTEPSKIVIVFPSSKPVKVYINENTMRFAKLARVYNCYIIPLSSLDKLITKLKRNNK